MEVRIFKSRKMNGSLTRKLIELHDKGYVNDFLLTAKKNLLCIQDEVIFPIEHAAVRLVYLGYDHLTNSFKYIHTIDTGTGEKGVLLADSIFTDSSISI
jgi:hypothetical protein